MINLHLEYFWGKSWKTPLTQNHPTCLSYSLSTIQWLTLSINPESAHAITALYYPYYTFEYVFSCPDFHFWDLFMTPLHRVHIISYLTHHLEQTNSSSSPSKSSLKVRSSPSSQPFNQYNRDVQLASLGTTYQLVCVSVIGLMYSFLLTLPWRRSLPYRNQSIDFLYDRDLHNERVNIIW